MHLIMGRSRRWVFAVLIVAAAPHIMHGDLRSAQADQAASLKVLLARKAIPGLRRATPHFRRSLTAFYAARGYAPIWAAGKAKDLIGVLSRAGDHGLVPAEYGLKRLALLASPPASKIANNLVRREILLSAAAALHAADLHAGRFAPRRINREIHLSPIRPEPQAVLERLAAAEDVKKVLAAFAPVRPEYRRLRAAYLKYLAIAAQGGWPKISAGKGIRKGDSGPAVVALRARLAAAGDLPKASNGPVFNDMDVVGLRRFQSRHGLFTTGAVLAVDLAQLNQSAASRVAQLRANLERRRWMQGAYGEVHLLVNQADFMVKVVKRNKTTFTSKIIIGTRYLRTPVFRATLKEIGFNPVWNVPASITRNELLPALRRNPKAYLRRRGMSLHDPRTGRRISPDRIDWSKVRRGRVPFQLRQAPGRRNALGRLKFVFPNPYNVYLHDTPSRKLFKRRLRCFSHGCMRLADPVGLAHVLLRDQGWSRARIVAAIKSGKRFSVFLKAPVPVHVVYLSAWVNKDGKVHFREDVYGRDRRLIGAFTRLDARHKSKSAPRR